MQNEISPTPKSSSDDRASLFWFSTLTVAFILVILFLGLRPTNWSQDNGVRWLPNEQALHFEPPGIAYVEKLHSTGAGGFSSFASNFSLHLAVSPSSLQIKGFRPILMIHRGSDHDQLTVWHWGESIIAMNGDDYDFSRRLPRISAKDVLRVGRTTFISVVSGPSGTRLFVDGILVREDHAWNMKMPPGRTKLRLVLGNSVYGKHGWYGEFHGLALYSFPMSDKDIARQYKIWEETGSFRDLSRSHLELLYTFGRGRGHKVFDYSGNNNTLLIPERPVILKRTLLSTPNHDLHSHAFWLDAFLNLFGFIPLGLLLLGGMRNLFHMSMDKGALLTVCGCFLLSLFMELLQGWLPGRFSSMLDLVLNTAGAGLGTLLYVSIFRLWGIRRPS